MSRTSASPIFLRLALVIALVLALGTAVLRSQQPLPGADRAHRPGGAVSAASTAVDPGRWWSWVVDR